MLAPGGRLVYSTCSLEPEENERVVAEVAGETSLRRLPIGQLISNVGKAGTLDGANIADFVSSAVKDNALRTLPGVHPCDGFFAVVLERN
jgi:16S rRNA (cytosine967-C5)-methyltransferase